MNKFVSFFLVFTLFFIFTISCYAVTPWGSVTSSSSQVGILEDYYFNLDSFKPFDQYVIVRIGEYQYRLYYGKHLEGDTVNYIDYQRYSNGSYNYEYRFSNGTENNFHLNSSNYTVVGNISGSLSSNNYLVFRSSFINLIMSLLVAVLFIFFILRIRFRRSQL